MGLVPEGLQDVGPALCPEGLCRLQGDICSSSLKCTAGRGSLSYLWDLCRKATEVQGPFEMVVHLPGEGSIQGLAFRFPFCPSKDLLWG